MANVVTVATVVEAQAVVVELETQEFSSAGAVVLRFVWGVWAPAQSWKCQTRKSMLAQNLRTPLQKLMAGDAVLVVGMGVASTS